jgi:ankyrin repeat protein
LTYKRTFLTLLTNKRKFLSRLLIAKGARVNRVVRGYTALRVAQENGHSAVVELLRKRGAKE